MMNKIKRTAALLLAVSMLGLVVLTLYLAVTGSPYFLASMVSMIILPVLVYAYMLVYRVLRGDAASQPDHSDHDDSSKNT